MSNEPGSELVATQVMPGSQPDVSALKKLEDGGNVHTAKTAPEASSSAEFPSRRMKAAAAACCLLVGCAAAIAIGLALSNDKNNSSSDDDDRVPPPIGVAVSGGGFRSMTQGMGVARAVGDNWPLVTHIGGASGGAWFANQFVYSKAFHDAVLGSEPLEEVLSTWGSTWFGAHAGAVAAGARWTKNATDPALEKDPICNNFIKAHTNFQQQFSTELGFAGIWNWFHFAHAQFGGWIDNAATARVGIDDMTGLGTATIVTMVAVMADAYINGSTRLAVREFGPAAYPADMLVPAALTAPPAGPAAWRFNEQLTELTARVGAGPAVPILPAAPTVLEVLAATGSATANAASRTWFRAALDGPTPPLPWLAAVEDEALYAYFGEHCLPNTMEANAAPLLAEKADLSAAALNSAAEADYGAFQDATTYRLADGGYCENTAAPSILASMQRDCDAGVLDCSGAHKLLIVDSSSAYTTPMFAGGGFPAGTIFPLYDTKIPSWQIFAEAPPANEAGWPAYATSTYPTAVMLGPVTGLAFTGNTTTVKATYWHGSATTVDNEWYGVQAGDAVDILILRGNTPCADVGGTADCVPSVTPSYWTEAWEKIYGPVAQDTADGAKPIIEAWLAGELPAN